MVDTSLKNRKLNENKISLLRENKFFNHEYTNKIGLEFVQYLTCMSYYSMSNPDPLDISKGNTLAKIFNYLKVIDNHINKPLNEYTQNDFEDFILKYREGSLMKKRTRTCWNNKQLSVKIEDTNECRQNTNLVHYINAFKRLWKVYFEYELNNYKNSNNGKEDNFNYGQFRWGQNLVAPRTRKTYVKYPWKSLQELIDFSARLYKEEYIVRFLVGINLMGRECELTNFEYLDIEFRENGRLFIKLPDIKKNSAFKVPVELYTYAKEPLLAYLKTKEWKDDDIIFPSKSTAYAKELKKVSIELWGKGSHITPKTIRKLGVCVAEQLGISRENVERIGGWSVNSDVLNHYFNRKGVEVAAETNDKIERARNESLVVELDKIKASENQKDTQIKHMEERLLRMEKLLYAKASQEIANKALEKAEKEIGITNTTS